MFPSRPASDLMKGSKDEEGSGENGDAPDNDDTEEDMDFGGADTKTFKTSYDGASVSRAKKRKRDATLAAAVDDEPNEGASPVKRRKKSKYGEKCYQTGSRHREQFDHPWDVGGVHRLECADIKVVDPLADLFSGVKVYIQPGVENEEQLRRYFIAYNGEVVESFQVTLATYIIADKALKALEGSSTQCLKSDWIWDSLKEGKQLPIEKYVLS